MKARFGRGENYFSINGKINVLEVKINKLEQTDFEFWNFSNYAVQFS